jgi:hypothetical protein
MWGVATAGCAGLPGIIFDLSVFMQRYVFFDAVGGDWEC